MTTNWLKSIYLGPETLTDEQAKDIPYPRLELHTHVATKFAQMGCILGMGVIGPAIGLIRGRSLAAVKQYSVKTAKVMTPALICLAPVMTEMTLRKTNSDDGMVYDRAYRIRMNEGQMRADRFADAGMVVGLAASAASKSALLPGAMAGFALGTVSAGIYTNVVLKKIK